MSRQTLTDLVNGHIGMSPEMVLRLDMAFASGADTWLRMQTLRPRTGPQERPDADSNAAYRMPATRGGAESKDSQTPTAPKGI